MVPTPTEDSITLMTRASNPGKSAEKIVIAVEETQESANPWHVITKVLYGDNSFREAAKMENKAGTSKFGAILRLKSAKNFFFEEKLEIFEFFLSKNVA